MRPHLCRTDCRWIGFAWILLLGLASAADGQESSARGRETTSTSPSAPRSALTLRQSATAPAGGAKELVPRKLPPKPLHARIPPGNDPRVIQVKFQDDLPLTMGSEGFPIDRGGGSVSTGQARRVLERIRAFGGNWTRVPIPEQRLDSLRRVGERNTNHSLADFKTYYLLRLPNPQLATQVLDDLNALPSVELATPLPRPAPPPTPPDYQSMQGYLNVGPRGIGADYAWAHGDGGTGDRVRIVDLEYGWNLSHMDLPDVGRIELDLSGVEPIAPHGDTDIQHGTAVLGELVSLRFQIGTGARWGTVGCAYGATMMVAPTCYDGFGNLYPMVILAALPYLQAGDVMLIEGQVFGPNWDENGPPQFGEVPVEWDSDTYNAVLYAVALGIHVVEAAGNGSQNLDSGEYYKGGAGPFLYNNDSGAIMVGAGHAPPGHGSDVDRSRVADSNYGSRVNLQGWGEGVTTTGYGTLWSADGPDGYYRANFSGTSAASPIVASAVALYESISKAETGLVNSVFGLRDLLVATGSPQQDGTYPATQHIGPRPDLWRALCMPVLTCPAPITVACSAPGGAPASDPEIADFLTGATVTTVSHWDHSITKNAPAFFPVGQTNVTFTASDYVGDYLQCTSSVTVTSGPALPSPYPQSPSGTCRPIPDALTWTEVPGAAGYVFWLGETRETGSEFPMSGSVHTIGNLTPNTTYYWRVKAMDACGQYGPYSDIVSFKTAPPTLSSPGLSSPANGATCQPLDLTLVWDDVPGENGYMVQYGRAGESGTEEFVWSTEHALALRNLTPDTTYFWQVKTRDACLNFGSYSDRRTFTTAAAAPAPPTPHATPYYCQPTSGTLTWSAMPTATAYTVEFGIENCPWNPGYDVTDTSYSYSGLTPGTQYTWRVKMKDCNGQYSDWSACSGFVTATLGGAAPSAPTLSSPSDGDTCVGATTFLSWQGRWNSGGYRVQVGTSCGSGEEHDVSASLTAPEYRFTGVAYDSVYYWRVRAKNCEGVWGDYSDCWTFTRKHGVPPPAPALVAPADDAVDVPWYGLVVDWEDVPETFEYEYSVLGGQWQAPGAEGLVTNSQSPSLSLLPGETYQWKVRAQKKCVGLWSDWSPTRTFTTRACSPTVLGPPTLQLPASGGTSPANAGLLDWTDVADAMGYRVQLGTSCGSGTERDISGPVSQYAYSDLTRDTKYYWRVKTCNCAGVWGTYSAPDSFTAVCDVLDPPALEAPADGEHVLTTTVTLDWADVLGASGYVVQCGPGCGGSFDPEHSTTESQYTLSGLSLSTTFHWRVRSKSCEGVLGAYGNCHAFTTPACNELGPPFGAVVPANGATCVGTAGTLDWSNVSGATGYALRLGTSCDTWTTYPVTASQYDYTGLAPHTRYYWRVSSRNCVGVCGPYSACDSFTTRSSGTLVRADGTGTFPTIQAALDAACAGDTILLASGTFRGDGNRDLDYHGKALVLRSASDNPDSCLIDCEGSPGTPHRGFYFHSHEDSTAVLYGVTILGGYAATVGGGAILADSSSGPTIQHCILRNNSSATYGGGLLAQNSSNPILQDCALRYNSAPNGGGMESYYCSPRLVSCEFRGNSATTNGGGLLNSHASPLLSGCTFVRNSAQYGGALMDGVASTPQVYNCTLYRNSASGAGGGIDDYGTGAQADVQKTIIAYDSLGAAAACGAGGAPVLSCCDLYGNTGGNWTGCIAGQASLRNNFSADPLFCEVTVGDLGLLSGSPCAPENNAACGLVGAWAEDCTLRPDLVVTRIDPDTVAAGAAVTVTIYVKNQGTIAAGATRTNVSLNEVILCAELDTPAIPVGGTVEVECALGLLSAGPHMVRACADATSLVTELSESNDCKNELVVVRAPVGVEDASVAHETRLVAIVPNPFTGTTTIRYALAQDDELRLQVLDVAGRSVRLLANGATAHGLHAATWDGRSDAGTRMTPGVYFVRLIVAGQSWTRTVLLLR